MSLALALALALVQEPAPVAPDPLARFDRVERRTARDRSGAHHARFVATVVDEEGAPIEGARAGLFGAGFNRVAPGDWLATATSDARGAIELGVEDLDGRLTLALDPPDGWLPHSLEVNAVDGGLANLGEIVLRSGVDETVRTELEGRVLLPDGSPAAGVIVSMCVPEGGQPGAHGHTDVDGRFRLDARGAVRTSPSPSIWVRTPGGTFPFYFDASVELAAPLELVLESEQPVPFELTGVEPDAVVEWSWHDGGTWRTCSAELVDRVSDLPSGDRWLRAGLVGRLPLVRACRRGRPARFDFEPTDDARYALRVLGAGRPLARARVDVVEVSSEVDTDWWRPSDSAGERCIESLVTDVEGRVGVLGRADVLYFVCVYAEGFEPLRARWKPEEELTLELAARDAPVRCEGLRAGELLEVRPAGHVGCAAVEAASGDEPVVLMLAPGDYDALVLGGDGAVLRGTSLTAVRDTERTVDLARDTRPRVTIALPATPQVDQGYVDGWREHGVEVHPWTGFATRARLPMYPAQTAQLDSIDEQLLDRVTIVPGAEGAVQLALNGTGAFTLSLVNPPAEVTHSFFRELVVRDGERVDLALPALDGTLRGESATYRSTPSFCGGVAGPRFALVSAPGADDASGWSLVNWWTVDRDGARFELPYLPAGRYFAFHHFVRSSRDVPGGVELVVPGAGAVQLADPRRDELFSPTIEVVDQAGGPVRDGWLRVCDPMHARWVEGGGGSMSSDPLPAPPELRLTGEPLHLPAVRAGGIELEVETDAGVVVRATRRMAPGAVVRIVVPE